MFRYSALACALGLMLCSCSSTAQGPSPTGASSWVLSPSPDDGEKPKQTRPLGAIGVGWTYLYADVGAGERESLNGWYVRPSLNLPHAYSLFVDFTNYYGTTKKGSLNSHGITAGVQKTLLPKARIRPGVFVEAGDVRSSNGTVVNQFAFNVGFNLVMPLNRHVAFTMTPAEWVFLYPKDDPRNDYNAKVGVSFNF